MAEDKIELPEKLSTIIKQTLKEKFSIENNSNIFSRDDLSLITSLNINQPMPGVLDGIEKLPSLESLKIQSIGISTVYHQKDKNSISKEDSEKIGKCLELKELNVINQSEIDSINLSELKKLTTLKINNNRSLKDVKGLENSKNLEELECYGNEKLSGIENLNEILVNNQEIYKTNLDIMMFPNAIGYDRENNVFDTKALNRLEEIQENCQANFSENIVTTEVQINLNQMLEMHEKACKIAENLNGTDKEIFSSINKYVSDNVKYAQSAHDFNPEKIITRARSQANGTHSAIVNGQTSKEGFVGMEKYIGVLKGIEIGKEYCEPYEQISSKLPNEQYHVIASLKGNDGQTLFADPLLDDKIQNQDEKNKNYGKLEHFKEPVNKELFKDTRISGVKEIEKNIKEQTKAKEIQEQTNEDQGRERGVKYGE